MQIRTVLGPIAPEELGITHMHEHLITDTYHIWRNPDYILDDVELAIDELRLFKEAGGDAIVEVTCRGMGRDPENLQRISRETGVRIIAATGFYTEPSYPREVYEKSTNELAAIMVREITEGIDGTEVRAGIIGELGTSRDYISPAEERVYRAAARAHRETGAAITTHTVLTRQALEQLALLVEEGVDPGRVIIGHMDGRFDMDVHRAIVDQGAYIAYDCVGKQYFQPDSRRVDAIAYMVEHEYESQLLLSSDISKKSNLHLYRGHGYDHLLRNFVPQLHDAGLSEEIVQAILIENPRRVLAF